MTEMRRCRWLVPAIALFAAACSERSLLEPTVTQEPDTNAVAGYVLCDVVVATAEVRCSPPRMPAVPAGARADLVHLGGQDLYVRLYSESTSYDLGLELFSTTVSVQNLTAALLGTEDGTTPADIKVFVVAPPVTTDGVGTVEVANEDGVGTFTASDQPFFTYTTILSPMEISDGKLWQFSVPSGVNTFSFAAYLSVSIVDDSAPLAGVLWSGAASTDFLASGNWVDGVAPDTAATVVIPPPALVAGVQPALTEAAIVRNLRIGAGSSLEMESYPVLVRGNVDVRGTMSGGTLEVSGLEAIVGGSLPATTVSGNTTLQRSTTVGGKLTLTGTLSNNGQRLTIDIP